MFASSLLSSAVMAIIMVGLILLGCARSSAQTDQDNWYLWQTNTPGSAPYGVTIGPDGRIFVSAGNGTIQACSNGVWSTFVSNSFGAGLSFNSPLGLITDSSSNLYVADAGDNCVFEFSGTGTFVRQFGPSAGSAGSLSGVRDVAIQTNGLVFVVENGNSRVSVFNPDGSFNSLFVTNGSLTSQVSSPVSIAIADSGKVYVTQNYTSYHQLQNLGGDTFRMLKAFDSLGNPLFQVNLNDQRFFQDECNNGHDYLGPCSVRVDRSDLVHVISSACGTYYQCINNGDPNYQMYWRVFTGDGTLLQFNTFSFGYEWNTGELFWPCQAIGPDGTVLIADYYGGFMKVYPYGRRELQPTPYDATSFPEVLQITQRTNSGVIDIYYRVSDFDDSNTFSAMLVFTNGTQSLSDCLVPESFTEGTGTNIDAIVPTVQPLHVAWNVPADWPTTNVANLRVAILAKDSRQGMLDVHYLGLPAARGMGPLEISASPLIQSDFSQVWWWLLATNDPGIALSNGVILGTEGTNAGTVFCSGDNETTGSGRAYVYQKMKVRQATGAEVSWAAQGGESTGVVNQWSPTISVSGRPGAVNEYGFDTGNWGTNAWWIVPLQ
jgi:hypothetical protein